LVGQTYAVTLYIMGYGNLHDIVTTVCGPLILKTCLAPTHYTHRYNSTFLATVPIIHNKFV